MLYRSDSVSSAGTCDTSNISDVHSISTCHVTAAATAPSDGVVSGQSACPVLTNESDDVHQFLTSHLVNGGIVNLLIAYLTELAQRRHFTW